MHISAWLGETFRNVDRERLRAVRWPLVVCVAASFVIPLLGRAAEARGVLPPVAGNALPLLGFLAWTIALWIFTGAVTDRRARLLAGAGVVFMMIMILLSLG